MDFKQNAKIDEEYVKFLIQRLISAAQQIITQ